MILLRVAGCHVVSVIFVWISASFIIVRICTFETGIRDQANAVMESEVSEVKVGM